MKDLVLYHAKCNDGLFAAYAHWLSKGSNANTIYLPVDYSETRGMSDSAIVEHIRSKVNYEDLSRVNVYVLDFSYPFAVISALSDMCNSVTLLDHHESAMLAYMEEINYPVPSLNGFFDHTHTGCYVMFDMNRSGAILAFKHFFPDSKDVPIWFKLVEDRDLWKFKYPETKAFALGVRNYLEEKSLTGVKLFKNLHAMLTTEYDKYLSIGNVLLNTQQARVNELKALGYYSTEINGYKAAFINAEMGISSDLANSIIEDGEVKIVIVYYILEVNGELLANLSIRSYKDVDSTFIAKALGGGGHPNACGARVTKETLDAFLQLKKITFK